MISTRQRAMHAALLGGVLLQGGLGARYVVKKKIKKCGPLNGGERAPMQKRSYLEPTPASAEVSPSVCQSICQSVAPGEKHLQGVRVDEAHVVHPDVHPCHVVVLRAARLAAKQARRGRCGASVLLPLSRRRAGRTLLLRPPRPPPTISPPPRKLRLVSAASSCACRAQHMLFMNVDDRLTAALPQGRHTLA